MHDAEDFVHIILCEGICLFRVQKNPIELLEQGVCLVQVHFQYIVVAIIH